MNVCIACGKVLRIPGQTGLCGSCIGQWKPVIQKLSANNQILSRRDKFVKAAMQGLAVGDGDGAIINPGEFAKYVVRIADALIAELDGEVEG